MNTVEDVQAALREMTREELDSIIVYAKACRAAAPSRSELARTLAAGPGTDEYDYILDRLCKFCLEVGRDARTVRMAKESRQYGVFKDRAPEVVKYLKTFCRNRNEELAALEFAWARMVKWPTSFNVAVGMSSLHRVPEALDEAFPGYYAAGMMPKVIGHLTGAVQLLDEMLKR